MNDESTVAMLREIRDCQRQHLEEYRRVANEALAIQKQALEIQQNAVAQQKIAVDAQADHLRLYRRVIVAAVILVGGAIWFLSANV
jgi:glycerol dehydrogenase-like iron-containing ADH family enzyme